MLSKNLRKKFIQNDIIKWYKDYRLTITQISELLICNSFDVKSYLIENGIEPIDIIQQDLFEEENIKGTWRVLSNNHIYDKYGHSIYLCQCTKCGNIREMRIDKVNKNKSFGCSQCQNNRYIYDKLFTNREKKYFEWRIKRTKSHAQERLKTSHLPFNITALDLMEIYYKQKGCDALTGKPIYLDMKKDYSKQNISIDRIDSNKGYIKDNIQLVSKYTNVSKWEKSNEEHIEYCIDVVKHYLKEKVLKLLLDKLLLIKKLFK